MNIVCGKDVLPVSSDELLTLHEGALEQAIQYFRLRAVGSTLTEYQVKLEEEAKEIYKGYVALNNNESKDLCNRLTEKLYSEKIVGMLQDGVISVDSEFVASFRKEWEALKVCFCMSLPTSSLIWRNNIKFSLFMM